MKILISLLFSLFFCLLIFIGVFFSSDLSLEELFGYLKRFHIEKGIIHPQLGDVDKLYSKFVKQHYLMRHKLSGHQENDIYEVTWGHRAHLELKMSHMADIIGEIMQVEKTPGFIRQLERASGIEGVFDDSVESSAVTRDLGC